MVEKEITLLNETGLHARPASQFIKEANKYDSSLKIIKDNKEYNGKSIMSILSMGANKDSKLTLIAEGKDENELINNIIELIKKFN